MTKIHGRTISVIAKKNNFKITKVNCTKRNFKFEILQLIKKYQSRPDFAGFKITRWNYGA